MTQKKILDTALKLFATKGYENTTTREICREVGLQCASLYAHFSSKEELFLSVLGNIKEKLEAEHQEYIELILNNQIDDYKETLLHLFKHYMQFFAHNEYELLFWQRIRFFPPVELAGKIDLKKTFYGRPYFEVYYDLFSRCMEKGQIQSRSVDSVVLSFWGFMNGYFDALILYKSQLTEEKLIEAFEIYWSGLI